MKTKLQEMKHKVSFKSPHAFAESIPMNPVTYTQYAQGIRNFTLEKAWEFADLPGCSLDELAGRQLPPEGASTAANIIREELVRYYDSSTAENRHSIVVGARNTALASREVVKRRADTEGASA